MRFRARLSVLVLRLPLVLVSMGTICSSAQTRHMYVVNTDPPSVSKVDTITYKIIKSVTLEAEPAHAILGREGRFLYVLQKGALSLSGKVVEDLSEVAVIDTDTMRTDKTVQAGWRVHKMVMSADRHYLALLSAGKRRTKKSDEEFPILTILDTGTNEVVARPSLRLSSVTYKPDGRELSNGFGLFALRNPTRFLIYDAGMPGADDEVLASLTMFGVNGEQALARSTFDSGGFLYLHAGDDARPFVTLSDDERWVYVVEHGKLASALKGTLLGKMLRKNKSGEDGRVHVLNTATLRTENTIQVGYAPSRPVSGTADQGVLVLSQGPEGKGRGKLYRFKGKEQAGVWEIGSLPRFVSRADELNAFLVVSFDEVRMLKDGSDTPDRYVPLRRNKARDGERDLSQEIKEAPSRSMAVLPKAGKIVLGLDKYELSALDFAPDDKIAVIGIDEPRLQLVDVGRGGVKFGNFMAGLGMSMGMAMGTGMAFYSAGIPMAVYPIAGGGIAKYGSGRILPAADGISAYVLNSGTRDVTVIDTAAGKQARILPVGRGCVYMFRSNSGQSTCVVCQGHLTVLDARKHEVRAQYDVTSGKVIDAYIDAATGRLHVLTSQSLIDFDIDKNVVAGVVTGLSSPRMVLSEKN